MHPATPGHHGTLQTAPNSFRMSTYRIGVRNPCRLNTYEIGLPQVLWNAHLRTVGGGGWGLIVNLAVPSSGCSTGGEREAENRPQR